MYKVELIPKQSTLDDIIGPWVNSGRVDNTSDGSFIFELADNVNHKDGALIIEKGENVYIYNLADFYRVKVMLL